MHPDDLAGSSGLGRQPGDGNGRGVGSQDGFRLHHRVQGGKEFLLEFEPLRCGFDHKITNPQVTALQGAANQFQSGFRVPCAQLALGYLALQVLANRLQPAVEKALFHLAQNHLKPTARKNMRDPIAHGPGAHHTHYLDFVHRDEYRRKDLPRPRQHAGDVIPASRSIGGLNQLGAHLFKLPGSAQDRRNMLVTDFPH